MKTYILNESISEIPQGQKSYISYQNKDSAFEIFFPFYVQYHILNAIHSDIVFLSKVKTTEVVVEILPSQSRKDHADASESCKLHILIFMIRRKYIFQYKIN